MATKKGSIEGVSAVEIVFEDDADMDDVDVTVPDVKEDDDDDDVEVVPEPKATKKPVRRAAKPAPEPVVEDDDEELDTDMDVPTPSMDFDIFGEIEDVETGLENPTLLVYGKNGTGKTTFLGTDDGVLILVTDHGALSLRGKTTGKRTKKMLVDSFEKIEKLYLALKKAKPHSSGQGLVVQLPDGPFHVRYIAWDTVTKLAQVCLRDGVLGAMKDDLTKDVLKKTIKDWGEMSERMKHWLTLYKELPVRNVWLCQEQSNSEDVEADEYTIMPAVNQAVRIFLQSEADIIGRTFIQYGEKEGKRTVRFRMITGPNPKCVTKDRTNKLAHIITNPNLAEMMKAVYED